VIGGQQAGILTGPLYSIHKVISIIVLAKQKERELGIPVIPVFWIAGEDHDYLEVNHIYAERNQKIAKVTYPEIVREKKMVSDIVLDKNKCYSWVEELIETFGETNHTNELLQFINSAIECSETFVDFFAQLIMEFFKEDGLLILDSGDKNLRRLEKDIFARQINEFNQITDLVFEQQKELAFAGFERTIEIDPFVANLFYYDEQSKSRLLLEYNHESGLFMTKNSESKFTLNQLIKMASDQPENLSNNVITRPLTQEWLFPTLAFIAGPGEIAYWSELKKVFEHFEMKMPPIVPRLNITILERHIDTDLVDLGLDLEYVLKVGTSIKKQDFIEIQMDQEITQTFQQLKNQLSEHYFFISKKTKEIDKGLTPLIEKNEKLILKQIEFMEAKIERELERKHEVVLSKYHRVGNSLRPNGSPQERIWNPLYFLNKYGLDVISRMVALPYEFDGRHKVIKL
jgi:bacillithiol synthase